MEAAAIILAGGSGTRFGNEKKQFYEFHGEMLYKIVYNTVANIIHKDDIVVVGVDVPGGNTRSLSVKNGLLSLNKDYDKVIILEAARPLVTEAQVIQILNNNEKSVSFVMPCVNSPIFRDGTYINRNDLYDLLVPQCFDYRMLKAAYNTGKYTNETDETRVMFSEYGIKPTFIETQQNLYKVTYKRDLAIIEEIYKMMQEGII